MTEPDRLADIREYLDALYGKNLAGPNDLIDVKVETLDWLLGEVQRLRDRVFELKIYEGFGQDHGHQRCIAEIGRLRELLARLEWAGVFRDPMDNLDQSACPVCEVQSPGPHDPGCWLAAELER